MARMRAPERKRQLLESAAAVFAERGYRGATTAELAAAAGISEPILYRHFDSKLELFVTLIDEVGAEVLSAWETRLAAADGPTARLHTLLESNPSTAARGRGVYRVIFQAMTQTDVEPRIREAITTHVRQLRTFVADELRSLQQAGVVRDDEPAPSLATMLIMTAIGYGLVGPISGTESTERLSSLLADLLTR